MDEFLSLLAALVSAAAAVVGTMVSLAQYRQARSAPQAAPSNQAARTTSPVSPVPSPLATRPPIPALRSIRPAAERSPRTVRRAVIVATVCCFAAAVNELSYWAQQTTSHSSALETLTNASTVVCILASLVGLAYAFRIAGSGVFRHRWRQLYVAGWVFLGSMTPWIGLWIEVLINRNFRGIGD